jgi:hypothetical protein
MLASLSAAAAELPWSAIAAGFIAFVQALIG